MSVRYCSQVERKTSECISLNANALNWANLFKINDLIKIRQFDLTYVKESWEKNVL
jgi:hypothetical protein